MFYGICDGKIYAWGANANGKTGLGTTASTDTTMPTQVGSMSCWTDIDASYDHSLGVCDGKLYAWGHNSAGQLGTGDQVTVASPVQIGSASDWSRVHASQSYSMAIRAGELYSWGANTGGTDGNGPGVTGLGIADGLTLEPTRVGSASNWIETTGGPRTALGLKSSG